MRRTLIILVALASVSCAALTSILPSPPDTAKIRSVAARIADGITVAEVALDQVGAFVDTLPLGVAQKDALDCGILKVNGHDAPSVTVLKVCGAVPPTAESPIGKALQALRTVTTQPGLCGVVRAVLVSLEPLLGRLEAAGASIVVVRTALGFTMRFAAGCQV
jgi:hypothetical protein